MYVYVSPTISLEPYTVIRTSFKPVSGCLLHLPQHLPGALTWLAPRHVSPPLTPSLTLLDGSPHRPVPWCCLNERLSHCVLITCLLVPGSAPAS